jgi:membrane-associated phospholipid phosphatase
VAAAFALVYGGANWLTDRRSDRVRIHLDLEFALPFVPAMILGYLSIYVLFALPPFVLRTRRELQGLALTLLAVIFGAGVGFLLLPAESAFPPSRDLGVWQGPMSFAQEVALRYNMVPSLHVAMSVVCVAAYARRAGRMGRLALWTWAGVIGVSTVLTHQHHLLDVATGCALGWAGARFVYESWVLSPSATAAKAQPPETPRPSRSSDRAPSA